MWQFAFVHLLNLVCGSRVRVAFCNKRVCAVTLQIHSSFCVHITTKVVSVLLTSPFDTNLLICNKMYELLRLISRYAAACVAKNKIGGRVEKLIMSCIFISFIMTEILLFSQL